MQKYRCINRVFLITLIPILICCEGIFVPDPIDPRLPKYTEDGNDVAGAFINQEIWRSVVVHGLWGIQDRPTISAYVTDDSLVIKFEGQLPDCDASVEFHLSGLHVHTFEDLILLRNRKIQLDGKTNAGIYIQSEDFNDTTYYGINGIGQLYIKNVTFGDTLSKAILSGTFGFTCYDEFNNKAEIFYGRFDYDFSEDSNFQNW